MSGFLKIAPIVEGHGEVEAVPLLLRRILKEFHHGWRPAVLPPIRQPRDRLVRNINNTLVSAVRFAAEQLRESVLPEARSLILILCDAEDSCALQLVTNMSTALALAAVSTPVVTIVAVPTYETWFAAAAASLTEFLDLDPASIPVDPERLQIRKSWIEKRFKGTRYSETVDQRRLTAAMDLKLCRRQSPSFDKLCRDISRVVGD
jgi:Domain of unknown function (DUF4276)